MKTFNFAVNSVKDIVNGIIVDAFMMNASDIHFDPSEKNLKVRIRVDGDLHDYTLIDNAYKNNLITRIKLLAGMNITEYRLPQDGSIKSTINGKDLDLRVSTLPTNFGEKVVIRILDYYMSLEGIEKLGFSDNSLHKIDKMLANPNGIILVTGATGSGKSTTVYAMLQKLNDEKTNIITVEDPIEMNLEGVNQIQVNSEIGLTFAAVLRSILRQDPNVILIGEIRDSETARIAIRSSITGHLVLSTLHTNNSLTTIERLLDMDVERYLLSSSLKGIISQSLAKRLCTKCTKKRPTTPAEKELFKRVLGRDVNEINEAVGCPECHSGYKGRISVQEVLLLDDSIRNAINENLPRQQLKEMIYKSNGDTMLKDGLTKVADGITSISEVYRLIDVDDEVNNIYVRSYDKEAKEDKKDSKKSEEIETFEEAAPVEHIDDNKKDEVVATKVDLKDTNVKDNNRSFGYDKEKSVYDIPGYIPTPKSRIQKENEYKPQNNLDSTQDIYKAILEKNNLIDETRLDTKDYTSDLMGLINKDMFD